MRHIAAFKSGTMSSSLQENYKYYKKNESQWDGWLVLILALESSATCSNMNGQKLYDIAAMAQARPYRIQYRLI